MKTHRMLLLGAVALVIGIASVGVGLLGTLVLLAVMLSVPGPDSSPNVAGYDPYGSPYTTDGDAVDLLELQLALEQQLQQNAWQAQQGWQPRHAPTDPWSGGGAFRGEAEVGGMPMTSGTFDNSGGGNHVISVDGEVLDLPF